MILTTFRRGMELCALVLLVALVVALATAAAPRLFGYRTVVVMSGSMGDKAPVGSLVLGKSKDAGDVAVGDVIVANLNNSSLGTLHRVISVAQEDGSVVVQTKGDLNPEPDPQHSTLPQQVFSMKYAIPYLGYLVWFSKKPLGWLFLVGIPALLIAGLVLRGVWAPGRSAPDHQEAQPEQGTLLEQLRARQGHQPVLSPVPEGNDAESADVAPDGPPAPVPEQIILLEQRFDELEHLLRSVGERSRDVEQYEAELVAADAALQEQQASLAVGAPALAAADVPTVTRLVERAAPAPPRAELVVAHLQFIQTPQGYLMAEQPGPPPQDGMRVPNELDPAVPYVVVRVGRSPLPDDPRPCAFLQLVGPQRPGSATAKEHERALVAVA